MIAGGNGAGSGLNQLNYPHGIYVDDNNQMIYIADYQNDRVVRWKYGARNGELIAGGNGEGDRLDQLHFPISVVYNENLDSVLICDHDNRRVVRWSCQNQTDQEIIISNIDCFGLALDSHGDLYVSDFVQNEVKRWKDGETNGTIVAGGNGRGSELNQFNSSGYIFIDQQLSIYVSDVNNHRVMKWTKDAPKGSVIAGGQGDGDSPGQLSNPEGITVDQTGNIYVADFSNNRIMLWSVGATEGTVVIDTDKLQNPTGLALDPQGNIYVSDQWNHRVQKFDHN